ncbi:MAG: FAD-dependent oxidoreductase [Terriglobia bacterium]
MSTAAAESASRVKLIERWEVAESTLAFRFERPSGFDFQAGQSVDMTLVNPPETDAEGNVRSFSIVSPPDEPTLIFATRMRDTAFKRVLKTAPLGLAVKIDGPFGNLTLHNNASRPAVLLAGGIGITPFHSMALRAAREKLPHRILLFYSNHRPEDAPFLDELAALERQNPNYSLTATMTDMEKSRRPWKGETGPIDQEMLRRRLQGITNAIYYIAGPPGMVNGIHTVVNNMGVDDDDIRTEEFSGY